MSKTRNAKFKIGQVVRHRVFPFRGVVFDIDPTFNNTDEWYNSIPVEVRPDKDQPFYHLFAENADSEYIAYVSEQNLLPDTSGEPVRHPQVAEGFEQDEKGSYRPRNSLLNQGLGFGRRPTASLARFASMKGGRPARILVICDQRGGAGCWPSSFLRASAPRFSSSSCNRLFWSATALGS